LARLFALRCPGPREKGLVLKREQGAAEDLDAAGLGAQRELLQTGDHLVGGDFFLGLAPTVAEIVGAEEHDHVRDTRLGHHVAVEAAQPAVATDVVKDRIKGVLGRGTPARPHGGSSARSAASSSGVSSSTSAFRMRAGS
jgi:hypothetical protein